MRLTAHRSHRRGTLRSIVAQARIYFVQFALALAFLGLGVWSLVAGRSGMGIFYLVLAAAWVLIGFFTHRRRQV